MRSAWQSAPVRDGPLALGRRTGRVDHHDPVVSKREHDSAACIRGAAGARSRRPVHRTFTDAYPRVGRAPAAPPDARLSHRIGDDLPARGSGPRRSSMGGARPGPAMDRRVCASCPADRRAHVRGAMSPDCVSVTSGNSSSERPSVRNSSIDSRKPCATSGSNCVPPHRPISEIAMSWASAFR